MPEFDPVARLVLVTLALYRLALLLAVETGPGDIFLRARAALGAYDRDATGRAQTTIGRLVTCPLCVGLWLALLAPGWVLWVHPVGEYVLLALALAGAQTALERIGRPIT